MSLSTESPLAYHRRKSQQAASLASLAAGDGDVADARRHTTVAAQHARHVQHIHVHGICDCADHNPDPATVKVVGSRVYNRTTHEWGRIVHIREFHDNGPPHVTVQYAAGRRNHDTHIRDLLLPKDTPHAL